MPSPRDIETALAHVKDQASLLQFLGDTLDWPNLDRAEKLEDLAYGWTPDDLRAQELEPQLLDGQVWQLQLQPKQSWGIFVVEFAREKVYRSALRKVLRGLIPSRQRSSSLPAWKHDNLLFICVTKDYKHFTFAYFRGDKAQQAKLATFGWEQGDRHVRTVCEYNLKALAWPGDAGREADAWLKQWAAAFDVEAVTKRFFDEYRRVFESVEEKVKGVPKGEARRLYVQRLFNRLMFLYFIQRKGWMSFQGNKNYLRAMFDATKEDFLNKRLYWAFFYGLNNAFEDSKVHKEPALQERRGTLPFLNGGLFDLEDEYDQQDKVQIPNAAFAAILDLFERYNFTVTESTPFDIEVAVDPEMLGKVFEELVTGRHESGSYYTPRPIVSFMCREALKHYLSSSPLSASERGVGGERSAADENLSPQPPLRSGEGEQEKAISLFVDEGDPSQLRDPEAILNALRAVKVCDPACGSGAYLLGMMQELLRLREALFKASGIDDSTLYKRKLEIIQNNLYGVDLDLFAVNIAKLRLWLSLAVDFIGSKPPPLPNLDFKIECGDSLRAPDPQKVEDMFRDLVVKKADKLAVLKAEFLESYGSKKRKLSEQIRKEEAELRESLQEQVDDGCVDWRVAFAEVFRNGGFDVALENPPYVRMELFKDSKPVLKRNFPQVFAASADLYVYFFARTLQILRPGGTACVISSNKWLKAGYGESLRRFFGASAWVASVVDFGHAKQIFQTADVFPSILVVRKPSAEAPPATTRVCAIPREQLRLDDVSRQVATEGFEFARERLGAAAWNLEPPNVSKLMEKLRTGGVPLREFAKGIPLYGIKTGFNEAFLVTTTARDKLIANDPKSEPLFRQYLRGMNLDRWKAEWDGLWMIEMKSSGNHPWPWANAGDRAEAIFRKTFPALFAHFSSLKSQLTSRLDQGENWWELRACAYWAQFSQPKFVIQRFAYYPSFAFDTSKLLVNDSVIFLPTTDTWIMGAINSPALWYSMFREVPHKKDEALAMDIAYVKNLPIPNPSDEQRSHAEVAVSRLIELTGQQQARRRSVVERLQQELGIDKPSQKLKDVAALNEDALVAEVQKARGKSKPLSVAQVKALKDEHVRSVRPLQLLAAEARQLERRVADLVNEAYGLTPEEVDLMWRTAPPRMPGERPR